MTETITKTSVAQKLKSKQFAHSVKFGSPKLRDLLRQKCRIRIKEARTGSFDNGRKINFTKAFFDQVIQSELNELNLDIELQDKIYQELIEDSWAFYNIEADTNYLSLHADDTPFLCPICQLTTLIQSDKDSILCTKCNIFIKCTGGCSMDEFQYKLQKILVGHETVCPTAEFKFFTEPFGEMSRGHELLKLNVYCNSCDYLNTVN